MKNFTAEYSLEGQYGYGICAADTIDELIGSLFCRGYKFVAGDKQRIISWADGEKKKFYGTGLTIRRGELEMTEYTSF